MRHQLDSLDPAEARYPEDFRGAMSARKGSEVMTPEQRAAAGERPECINCQAFGGPGDIERPDIICAIKTLADGLGVRQPEHGQGFFCAAYWPHGVSGIEKDDTPWLESRLDALDAADARIAELETRAQRQATVIAAFHRLVEEADNKAQAIDGQDGFIAYYIFQTGPWHRLLALARDGERRLEEEYREYEAEREHWARMEGDSHD